MKPRAYAVTYRAIQWPGQVDDFTVSVKAYTAEDAAFQALIEPERVAKANSGWGVELISVVPEK